MTSQTGGKTPAKGTYKPNIQSIEYNPTKKMNRDIINQPLRR